MSDENIIKKVGRKLFLMKADFIKNHLVKNKDISIIANNCIGADISHSLNLRFNSPTVNLQILPYYFPRFVKRLEYYMGFDIEELTDVDE